MQPTRSPNYPQISLPEAVKRIAAVYEADRQRSEAQTELAQMRASGVLVGCVTCGLSLFLMATQAERVRAAYSSPLGVPVGLLVGAAIAAPLIGGILLARIDDVDY